MKAFTLWHGDCLELMKNIPDGSVDLTVTSPPYDNLRTYSGNITQWNFEKFKDIAKELYRVTANGGVVVWIVGDATINGSETGTSFKQALFFKEIGFNLHDTMIYEKPPRGAVGNNRGYWQSFEYMFVFSKGKPRTINLIKDRKNSEARSGDKGTKRLQDGTLKRISRSGYGETAVYPHWNGHLAFLDGKIRTQSLNANVRLTVAMNTQLAERLPKMATRWFAGNIL